MKKIVSISLFSVLLSACDSLRPLPVVEPEGGTAENPSQPDFRRGGLIPAHTADQAVKNLKIYADSYYSTGEKLRASEFDNSDLTLMGGILALVGGVAKSVEVAVAGGILSAGSSISSQRYQLKIQAANYEKAGDAMSCMYRNGMQLKPIDVKYLSESPSFINEKIDEVRGKLRKAQISVDLLSPKTDELEKSLKQLQGASTAAAEAQTSLFSLRATFPKFSLWSSVGVLQTDEDKKRAVEKELAEAQDQLNKAKVEKINSEITKCVALI